MSVSECVEFGTFVIAGTKITTLFVTTAVVINTKIKIIVKMINDNGDKKRMNSLPLQITLKRNVEISVQTSLGR